MSDDLVARLRHAWDERERQLAEDERVALGAHANVWTAEGGREGEFTIVPDFTPSGVGIVFGAKNARHIARYDPARVLAEVKRGRRDLAAKRRILTELSDAQSRQLYYERDGEEPFVSEARANVEALQKVLRLLAEAEGLA